MSLVLLMAAEPQNSPTKYLERLVRHIPKLKPICLQGGDQVPQGRAALRTARNWQDATGPGYGAQHDRKLHQGQAHQMKNAEQRIIDVRSLGGMLCVNTSVCICTCAFCMHRPFPLCRRVSS